MLELKRTIILLSLLLFVSSNVYSSAALNRIRSILTEEWGQRVYVIHQDDLKKPSRGSYNIFYRVESRSLNLRTEYGIRIPQFDFSSPRRIEHIVAGSELSSRVSMQLRYDLGNYARMQHVGGPQVHGLGIVVDSAQQPGAVGVVVELIQGRQLHHFAERHKSKPEMLAQFDSIVQASIRAGWIPGDLHTGNIIVSERGLVPIDLDLMSTFSGTRLYPRIEIHPQTAQYLLRSQIKGTLQTRKELGRDLWLQGKIQRDVLPEFYEVLTRSLKSLERF